jgi:peptide/nickel transport system permease protein
LLAFVVRRLLFLPVVFFGVTVIIVLLMQLLTPAQRAVAFVRSDAQLRNLPAIIRQYGLDQPFYVQYWNWLREASQGNFGYSRVTRQPVWTTIRARFPATIELAVAALLSILGWSLPTFVMGIWLLVIFYGGFGLFPPGQMSTQYAIQVASGGFERYTGFMTLDALLNGRFDIFWDVLKHLVLPVITLTIVSSAQIMRVMRSSLLDALSQDYVRTARAKGLRESVVNRKHARRNALIPILTLSGFTLIGLLNGVVITETIFAYPGLGNWLASAATQLDYAAILGGAVFTAAIVVVANLIVDVLYGLVDPRIRY